MKRAAILISLLFFFSAVQIFAFAFDRLSVGTAANGMGGAFTAVCNDATIPYWNAAGLAYIKSDQMELTYSDLLGLGALNHYFLSYLRSFVGPGAAGFSWDHLGTKNELSPLNFSEDIFYISYGLKLFKVMAFGGSAKYYIANYDTIRGSAYSIDYGGLIPLGNIGTVGFNYHDANIPRVRWYTGSTEDIARGLNLGVSLTFFKPVMLSYDIENILKENRIHHIGAGVGLFKEIVNICGGIIIVDKNQLIGTGGLKLKYKGIGVGWCINFQSDLPGSQTWSVSAYF